MAALSKNGTELARMVREHVADPGTVNQHHVVKTLSIRSNGKILSKHSVRFPEFPSCRTNEGVWKQSPLKVKAGMSTPEIIACLVKMGFCEVTSRAARVYFRKIGRRG